MGAPSPLFGQRVVITRAPHQAGELSRLLQERGATVFEVPVLAVVPVGGEALTALDASVSALARGDFDAVLFTSANAVVVVHERMLAASTTVPHDLPAAVFAIGRATARTLAERGWPPATVPQTSTSEGLLSTVRDSFGEDLTDVKVLLPRAREGREVLIEGLRQAGAQVEIAVAYETLPLEDGPSPPAAFDWVIFASPKTARAYVTRFGPPPARVACIGPVTQNAVQALSLEVSAVAAEQSAPSVVAAMEAAST